MNCDIMGIKRKVLVGFMDKIGVSQFKKIIELERSVTQLPDMLLPTEDSPLRFQIPLEMIRLVKDDPEMPMHSLPPIRIMPSLMSNMKKVVNTLPKNPQNPLTEASPDFLQELKEYAQSVGTNIIGFTKLPRDLIFQENGILHENTIVLAMEMDWDKMEVAPSRPTQVMIMETYDTLGIAANKIADFLREHGFSAMAGHPLGGMALYPPLAQNAGLGWIGRNGLLITPEFGPRVRLAAIYTSIANLPFSQDNEHTWVRDYCDSCGICIRKCPPEAIREIAMKHDYGRVSHIVTEKCFPYFAEYFGCSICIKVCPFNRRSYEDLKSSFESK